MYVFGLNAANSAIIFSPTSFFINQSTFIPSNVMVFLIHDLEYQIFFQHPLQYLCIYLLFLCRLYSYLYPFNIILLFLHIFFSRDHTKTHESLFYLLPILINLNRLVYSWVSVFFPFLLVMTYLKKLCCLIVWFWYLTIPSGFDCYKLNISMISHIFHSF